MPGPWVVYACRTAYTGEVLEIVGRRGEAVAAQIDNLPESDAIADALAGLAEASIDPATCAAVVPLLTPGFRHRAVTEARGLGFGSFPALVDPTAVVAATAALDDGVVVNAGVVIGASTQLGAFVHVNRSASLGHDGVVADFATIGPGCVLSGSVTVERGAFLGAGVVCVPGVTIGADAVVGAGAVVVRDVGAGETVVGNPARVVRTGGPGYGGVVVPGP